MATYTCPNHQRVLSDVCPDCAEAFAHRRDPDTMTGDERAAEFDFWGPICTIPFGDIHQRLSELVGRPVFTHELAGDAACRKLQEEARTRVHPTPREILEQIPAHKRIVISLDE